MNLTYSATRQVPAVYEGEELTVRGPWPGTPSAPVVSYDDQPCRVLRWAAGEVTVLAPWEPCVSPVVVEVAGSRFVGPPLAVAVRPPGAVPEPEPAPVPEPEPGPGPVDADRLFSLEVLRLTNLERARVGLEALGAADAPLSEGVEISWWSSRRQRPATVLRAAAKLQAEGLTVLVEHAALTKAAEAHVRDMSTRGYFSHTGLDGSSPSTRAKRAGWTGQGLGENLYLGPGSPAQVVAAFMGSSGHRANLLNPFWNQIGVGHVAAYTCQMFGRAG